MASVANTANEFRNAATEMGNAAAEMDNAAAEMNKIQNMAAANIFRQLAQIQEQMNRMEGGVDQRMNQMQKLNRMEGNSNQMQRDMGQMQQDMGQMQWNILEQLSCSYVHVYHPFKE